MVASLHSVPTLMGSMPQPKCYKRHVGSPLIPTQYKGRCMLYLHCNSNRALAKTKLFV